jgi:hypothetical protein
MRRDGDRLPQVRISVQCDRDTDIAVFIHKSGPQLSTAQKRVIVRFLQICHRESDGSVHLGSANLICETTE